MVEDMLPIEFLDRMEQMLGGEYAAFLESFVQERYQALRLNSLKKGTDGRTAAEALRPKEQELKNSGVKEQKLENSEMKKQKLENLEMKEQKLENSEMQEQDQDAGRNSQQPEELALKFAHLTKVPWAENGYYYQAEDQPGKHPYHDAGLYYIQEPSAMVPAELLGVRPGERVLDLCAAPGGKSTQIAAKLQGKGLLLCNEIHPARAKILSENIERMGIANACVTNETPERLAEFFPEYFDRILVDAPCSGEGMFRKNEGACEEWSPENVTMCACRQDGILDCAARMLRPGGRLVYSTCTFAPEEDEGSVARFLQRHEDFGILPIEKEKVGLAGCDGTTEWLSGDRNENAPGLGETLRLWPHKVKGEGHFAALLYKEGEAPGSDFSHGVGSRVKGLSEKELKELGALEELNRFCRENLRFPAADEGTAYRNGATPDSRHSVAGRKAGGKMSGRQKAALSESQGTALAEGLGKASGLGKGSVWIRFGDHLYLAPADMPPLRGLKVLRPGLHIGEIKKNRFEPSHALALALAPENAAHKWNLLSDSREILDYLCGGTFPAEGENGWYLICVDGFGTGWGKLAAGVMKNHYPKGLRKNR